MVIGICDWRMFLLAQMMRMMDLDDDHLHHPIIPAIFADDDPSPQSLTQNPTKTDNEPCP